MKKTSAIVFLTLCAVLITGHSANARHPSNANLIGNIEGTLQLHAGATFNSATEEYFVTFAGDGFACGTRIDVGGNVLSTTYIAPPVSNENPYGITSVIYNPDEQNYFVTYRNDEPRFLNVRAIGLNGAPLADQIRVDSNGGGQELEYNPTLRNFMFHYGIGASGVFTSYFRMLSGPFNNIAVGTRRTIGRELVPDASFSTGANKFLYVTAKGHPPDPVTGEFRNGSDVVGRFISSDGSSTGQPFFIAQTPRDETGPHVAYAPSSNNWLVIWQKSSGNSVRSFDVQAALVDANGNKVTQFFVAANDGWDAPFDVVYNEAIDMFVVAWFLDPFPRLALVNPHDGTVRRILQNDKIQTPNLIPGLGDGVRGLATRPHSGNPQALLVWSEGHGLSGVHGTIINLKTGAEIPVTGGDIPCRESSQQVSSTTTGPPSPPGDDGEPFFTLPPPPGPEPELKVEKFVRNITKGQTASHDEIQQVGQFEVLQFITLITSQTDRTLTGLVVHDILPDGMTFRDGSTLVDGSLRGGDDVIQGGLAIGEIEPGGTRTVRWSGQVKDLQVFGSGLNTLELPVAVTTDDAGTFFSVALLGISDAFLIAQASGLDPIAVVQRGLTSQTSSPPQTQEGQGAGLSQAGIPNTGAGGTILFSLLGAALASLAYAGYTRSGQFHRRQAIEVSEKREPMDFRE